MSIHKGHRQRVKEEFLSGGLDHFTELRSLELLLFYSRAQGDVNVLAHRLMERFGSLAGVLDAPIEELLVLPGVGENTAVLLKLVPAMGQKYLSSRTSDQDRIENSWDIRRLFLPYFFGAKNEMSYLACLDGKLRILGVRKISEGIPNATDIRVRQVVSAALAFHASAVILAHNHTSGIATPSHEDVESTRFLRSYLARIDIDLYDHVILVDDDMVSLRDSRLLL